jgi:hypothetical protein
MKNEWYEKYIGYCFTDNGKEVILNNIYTYENGKKCYEMKEKQSNGTYETYICDWKTFKNIAHQTVLPKN